MLQEMVKILNFLGCTAQDTFGDLKTIYKSEHIDKTIEKKDNVTQAAQKQIKISIYKPLLVNTAF